jgi:hypothetical protein
MTPKSILLTPCLLLLSSTSPENCVNDSPDFLDFFRVPEPYKAKRDGKEKHREETKGNVYTWRKLHKKATHPIDCTNDQGKFPDTITF